MNKRFYFLMKNHEFFNNLKEFAKLFISAGIGFALGLLLINIIAFIITIVILSIVIVIFSIVLSKNQHSLDILKILTDAKKKGNWAEMLRFGYPLSRPLWLNGSYSLRIEVGEMIKVAAASIDENIEINDSIFSSKYLLSSILIDDLGFTRLVNKQNVELGVQNIKQGILIAEANNFYDLLVKGYRHLISVIADQQEIQSTFSKIDEYVLLVTDTQKRSSLEASILFSKSEYYLFIKDYPKAYEYIIKAKDLFESIDDRVRYLKTYNIISKIYLEQKDYINAEAAIRKGINESRDERKELFVKLVISLFKLILTQLENGQKISSHDYFVQKEGIDDLYNDALLTSKAMQNSVFVKDLNKIYKVLIEKLKISLKGD